MNPMATDPQRRRLLQGMAAGLLAWPLRSLAGETPLQLLSAYDVGRNEHRVGAAGRSTAATLPQRGHHIALLPGRPQECLVFARRPGSFIARLNWQSGETLAWYDYPDDRHGFGHGIVLPGGVLLTTDSNIDSGDGLLTLRDALTLAPQRELPSGGIGPHQLLPLQDGRILVANGGILTLPESGRIKLNVHSMQPSLDIVDLKLGRSVASFRLPDSKLSLRHLAAVADGHYAVALQYEGEGSAPLVSLWHERSGLRNLPLPAELASRCNGYAASVAATPTHIACTATKGDQVMFWSGAGEFLGAVALSKPAGIAATPDQRHFIVSNELGDIVWIDSRELQIVAARSQHFPVKWDNHLVLL